MSVALNDIPACQHVLRILLDRRELCVKSVRTQYTVSKMASRGARLDVLAEDGQGVLYNIEIQRRDTADHARRTRFYSAMLDGEFLEKGNTYDAMPELYLLYISESDIWKGGKAVYPVTKYLGGADADYDDGVHILYINAEVDDGTETAALMRYFKTADPEDLSQGELSKRIHFLKCEEGGREAMCEITEAIRQEGIKEGIQQGVWQGKKEAAANLAEMGMTVDNIALAVNEKVTLVRQWLEAGTALEQ